MKRLVLTGGGHAHLHVLKTLAAGAWPGVELALAIRYRLTQALPSAAVQVTLVEGRGMLAGHGAGVVRRLAHILEARGVVRVVGHAAGVDGGLLFPDGHRVAADCVIAATAQPVPAGHGTPPRGGVVGRTDDGG
jgi:NADH dehydrogenase FAD-containing subunit